MKKIILLMMVGLCVFSACNSDDSALYRRGPTVQVYIYAVGDKNKTYFAEMKHEKYVDPNDVYFENGIHGYYFEATFAQSPKSIAGEFVESSTTIFKRSKIRAGEWHIIIYDGEDKKRAEPIGEGYFSLKKGDSATYWVNINGFLF